MNKYGYFIYQDKPETVTGDITTANATKQTGADDVVFIHNSSSVSKYNDWATFEQGAFDFEKELFISGSFPKVPFTSQAISNAVGEFTNNPTITVNNLGDTYSGGGFSIKTYYEEYTVKITVSDNRANPVSKTFAKTKTQYADEFFPFPHDGLTQVVFEFEKIPPYHFFKVLAVDIGGTRILNESDFVEEPQIVTNFSLTNEELALDTLSLRIRGDKEDFYFIAGEKITYSADGKNFYVSTAEYGNDGTISVECYDDMAKLDKEFDGIMRFDTAFSKANLDLLIGEVTFDVAQSLLVENQAFMGTISNDVSKREALRILLQGNGLALKRINNTFNVFCISHGDVAEEFTEADIIGLPEVQTDEKITRVHFSRHNYKKQSTITEVFRDTIPIGESKVLFSEPYVGKENNTIVAEYYQVVNGTLEPISPSGFVTTTGAYYRVLNNSNINNEIVIMDYQYKVTYTAVDVTPNVSNQFKDNEVMISDCTISLKNFSDVVGRFKSLLSAIYKHNKLVMFSSLKEANAGDMVTITFGNESYIGWILKKTNYLNGVYDYEVKCEVNA